MSAHLPECDEYTTGVTECLCKPLRACERRVTERHNAEHEDDRLAAFSKGYRTGVQVARDAVAASSWRQLYPYIVDELVVAIDQLITKNSGENYE